VAALMEVFQDFSMQSNKTKSDSNSKDSILELIRTNRRTIKSFGVRKVGLFGSFARNEQSPESDVDLLVEFEKGKKNFDNFIHLNFFLEGLLKRRVEVVTTQALSPHIGPHILKEVIYVSLAS
jgi:predicted nucleotidyltransferase